MIERISHFSYGLLGKTAEGLTPHLRDLELRLKRAGIRVSLPAYISFIIFTSILILILSLAAAFAVSFFFFRLTLLSSTLLSLTTGMIAFALTFALTYTLPSTMTGRRRKEIEVNLPFTLSYMSILSSAGLPPNRVFKALAVLEERGQLGLAGEASNILRDIEVFGVDLATALKEAARRSPSPALAGILEGMISTIHAGGDLSKYFEEEARELMGIRRITLREFVDVLLMLLFH
jgi:flagellar protein FlaJ